MSNLEILGIQRGGNGAPGTGAGSPERAASERLPSDARAAPERLPSSRLSAAELDPAGLSSYRSRMKTLGIIGGLGPDTTAEFYRMVIRRARCRFTDSYPRVLVHSIPVPFSVERSIVRYGRGEEEMFPFLS